MLFSLLLVQAWTAKFSPDSKHIATGTASGDINQYSVESGEKVQTFEGRGKFAMSVAYVSFRGQLRSRGSRQLSLRNAGDWTLTYRSVALFLRSVFRALTENMLRAELRHRLIRPPSSCLTLPPASSATPSRVKSVPLLRLHYFHGKRHFSCCGLTQSMIFILKIGHAMTVRSLAFSADSTKLVTGSDDKRIMIHDA